MKRIWIIISALIALSCNEKGKKEDFNKIAEEYVKLGLDIGRYDPDFVDAYYGPDSLKPAGPKLPVFPKYVFLNEVKKLMGKLEAYQSGDKNDTVSLRATWLHHQLEAFEMRIRIFSGERKSFDEESKALFGAVAPIHTEAYYQSIVKKLDSVLPGNGDLYTRFQEMANHFIIPKDKIDTVFKTAVAESRKRTRANYSLPDDEHFTLEYVTGKSWSGYNWYKGNFTSLIQINTDTDIFIERAIDVASHESYPGHHVYNMLLEKNLYRDKGWVEISLYPLYSPQSLIAEGSANYGIELAFPGNERNDFSKQVLLPLAGLDTTGIEYYFKALQLKTSLNFARNEVGRGLLNKTMTEPEALRWLMQYGLSNRETAMKSISFIKNYGSYIINYNYGMELVRDYVESNGGVATAPAKRWELFGKLLSTPVTPAELAGGKH